MLKRIPYWLYWIMVASIGFLIGEVSVRILGENYFFWARVIFAAAVAIVPSVHIWLFHSFDGTVNYFSQLLWDDEAAYKRWLATSKKRNFVVTSRLGVVITSFIATFGMASVFVLGFPFKSVLFTAAAIIVFAIFLIMCGHALHITLGLLLNLAEMASRPVRTTFYMLPRRSIAKLQNYYLLLALTITILYVALVIAVWQGPYGFHPLLLAWLTGLALYPLSIYITTFAQTHRLMQNIKYFHVETVNSEVQKLWQRFKNSGKAEDLEELEKLMEIQNKVEAMKEWPVDFQGAVSLLVALLPIALQTLISVLNLPYNEVATVPRPRGCPTIACRRRHFSFASAPRLMPTVRSLPSRKLGIGELNSS